MTSENKLIFVFTESAPTPIQTISRDVRLHVVSSQKPRFPGDWRPLVEERVANVGSQSYLKAFDDFLYKKTHMFWGHCELAYCA